MRVWPHLLKRTLMENFIFCAVLKKNIFLGYCSASFCLQKLLLTSELYVRELEICEHCTSPSIVQILTVLRAADEN